ncbi:hypothetical protein M0R04_06600 [Candidatus Dojkabacteria bacterium]|jgi:hypothetical protein|nr:hypothetical protein [Candidatus Dojkabacteria bacterium]
MTNKEQVLDKIKARMVAWLARAEDNHVYIGDCDPNKFNSVTIDGEVNLNELAEELTTILKLKDYTISRLTPFRDETLITVLSALGINCGEFLWPTKHLHMLTTLNKYSKGYIFQWKNKKH